MKGCFGLVVAAALVCSVYADSILLKPGESYVFSFDARSLPEAVASPFGDQLFGGFDLVANGGESSGCHWLIEMFENSVTEQPIFRYEQERSEDCSLQPLIAGAWQDLQGAVRVTAISETLVAPMERRDHGALSPWFPVLRFYLEPMIDTDGDGVPDREDHCPNTQPGVAVNANGCSIEQLVSCDGPVSGGGWKNHGEYVRAVGEVVTAFVRDNRITVAAGQKIVAAAAHSNCGKK